MPQQSPSLLPPELMSFEDQRSWILGSFAALQAYKLYQFTEGFFDTNALDVTPANSPAILLKWFLIDLLVIGYVIPRLRIPRLDWPIPSRLILLFPLLTLNYLLFSPSAWHAFRHAPTALISAFLPEYKMAVDEHRVRTGSITNKEQHILGRVTINVLPHASARLNPDSSSFCLPANSPQAVAFIPLSFNNSRPHSLTYSHTDFESGQTNTYEVFENQLLTASAKKAKQKQAEHADISDDWLVAPGISDSASQVKQLLLDLPNGGQQTHDTTKSKKHASASHALQIKKPGLVKLTRIQSGPPLSAEIPFSRMEQVSVVECPSAVFAPPIWPISDESPKGALAKVGSPDLTSHKCLGDTDQVNIILRGAPPFSLEYTKSRGSSDIKHEPTRIEAISSDTLLKPGTSATIDLPLNYTLDSTASISLKLVRIEDAFHNEIMLDEQPERKIIAHAPPRAVIQGCSEENPLKLLEGSQARFAVNVQGITAQDGPYHISIKRPDGEMDHIKLAEREHSTVQYYQVSKPGVYSVVDIAGKFCSGDLMAPTACSVVLQPKPTASISFEPINDQCAGSIGLRGHLILSGEVPFKLHYRITEIDENKQKHVTKQVKTIMQLRDEIVFQPDRVGHFTWEAVKLEDAAYIGPKGIELDSKSFQGSTEVHSLAGATWKKINSEDLRSCDGKSVVTQLELTGMAPWTIQYETQFGSTRQKHTIKDVKTSPHKIEVPIPAKLDKSGGFFTLSLLQVQDKRGCKRTLQTPDLQVHVLRTKPTARFYVGKDKVKKIRQGQDVTLPVRLTGESPWKIKYRVRRGGQEAKDREVSIKDPNGGLLIDEQGTYELVSVKDRYCPGNIIQGEKDFIVEFLAKPSLTVKQDSRMSNTSSSIISRRHTLKRANICLGNLDSIELLLTGMPPFQVYYDVVTINGHRQSKSLLAVQHTANLILDTHEAGSSFYEITGVTDSLYTDPKDGLLLAHGVGHHGRAIRIEQTVLGLPTGTFRSGKTPNFCVNDELGARTDTQRTTTTDLMLRLDGTPPFDLHLEVKPMRSTVAPQRFSSYGIEAKEWAVKVPFSFANAGRYEVKLWSIRDGNGCEKIIDEAQVAKSPASIFDEPTPVTIRPPTAMVDVVDTANIIAAQPRRDHCVGENLDFILQGSAPWTITYDWEGHKREVVSRKPTFSRFAEKPGIFTVARIAHQQNQCSSVVNIIKEIHPLPTVTVSSGSNTVQDIREGDEALITFHFKGTPPYTFKYTRSMPQYPYEILEEKTVAAVMEDSFTITASTEGSWAVTFIQDRWCSFP